MTTEWSVEDETTLFQSLIKCRPVGIHHNFRMINLYLTLNPEKLPTRFSMSDIRKKLDTLYDIDHIQNEEMEKVASATGESGEEDSGRDDRDGNETGLRRTNFSLPYIEYRDVIEAHAQEVSGSVPASPSQNSRDPRSSPAPSQRTESVVPDDDNNNDTQAQSEEEGGASPVATPAATRGRKRRSIATTTLTRERSGTNTPRSRKAAAAAAATDPSTPAKGSTAAGESDDEGSSVAGSTTRGAGVSKRGRIAPSRKSSRRK